MHFVLIAGGELNLPVFAQHQSRSVATNLGGLSQPMQLCVLSKCNATMITHDLVGWWAAALNPNAVTTHPTSTSEDGDAQFWLPNWIAV